MRSVHEGHTEDTGTRNRLGSTVKVLTRIGGTGEAVKYMAEGKNWNYQKKEYKKRGKHHSTAP